MCWEIVIPAAAGLFSSGAGRNAQSNAADSAAAASRYATDEQIGYARESRDLSLELGAPYRQAANPAMAAMMDMMGLDRGQTPAGPPGAGGGGGPGSGSELFVQPDGSVRPGADNRLQVGGGGGGGRGTGGGGNARGRGPNGDVRGPRQRHVGTAGGGRTPQGGPPGAAGYDIGNQDLGQYDQYDWQTDPGYEFRMSAGTRRMDASASARGQLYSGGAMRDALQYGQDMASQEYMNIYNRLGTLAGFGSTGTTTGVNASNNYGAQAGAAAGNAGYTRASAYTAQGNADAGFWGDVAGTVGGIDWGSIFNSSGGGGALPGFDPTSQGT